MLAAGLIARGSESSGLDQRQHEHETAAELETEMRTDRAHWQLEMREIHSSPGIAVLAAQSSQEDRT